MQNNAIYLPDTNSILRYLLQDHEEFSKQAFDFWEAVRLGQTRARLSEGVLIEAVYVLQRFYKIPREKITASLKPLLAYKGIRSPELTILKKSLDFYAAHNLDFVDCILAVRYAEKEGVVFTFDKKLSNAIAKM